MGLQGIAWGGNTTWVVGLVYLQSTWEWERSLGKGRGTPKGILGLSPNVAFGNSFGDRLLCIQEQTRFWSLSCEVCKTNSWAVTGGVGAPVQI